MTHGYPGLYQGRYRWPLPSHGPRETPHWVAPWVVPGASPGAVPRQRSQATVEQEHVVPLGCTRGDPVPTACLRAKGNASLGCTLGCTRGNPVPTACSRAKGNASLGCTLGCTRGFTRGDSWAEHKPRTRPGTAWQGVSLKGTPDFGDPSRWEPAVDGRAPQARARPDGRESQNVRPRK